MIQMCTLLLCFVVCLALNGREGTAIPEANRAYSGGFDSDPRILADGADAGAAGAKAATAAVLLKAIRNEQRLRSIVGSERSLGAFDCIPGCQPQDNDVDNQNPCCPGFEPDHPYKELNCLLKCTNIQVAIPLIKIDTDFVDMHLQLTNLNCYRPYIGSLALTTSPMVPIPTTRQVDVTVDIDSVAVTCEADFTIRQGSFGIPDASGHLKAITRNAHLDHLLEFKSEGDFATNPPREGLLDDSNCKLQLNLEPFTDETLTNAKCDGNYWGVSTCTGALQAAGKIAQWFNEQVRGLIEDNLSPLACTELSKAITDLFTDLLSDVAEVAIFPYLGEPIRVKKNMTAVLSTEVAVSEGVHDWNLKSNESFYPPLLKLYVPKEARQVMRDISPLDLQLRVQEWNSLVATRKAGQNKTADLSQSASSAVAARGWFEDMRSKTSADSGDPLGVMTKVVGVEGLKPFGDNDELGLKTVSNEWERLRLGRVLELENITNTVYWDILNDLITQELTAIDTDEESPNFNRPKVNNLITDLELGAINMTNGTLHVDVVELVGNPRLLNVVTDVANVSVGMTGFRIAGLNTFNRFEPLTPIGTNSFFLDLELDGFTVYVDIELNMTTKEGNPEELGVPALIDVRIFESFTLSFEIKRIDFEVGLFLALDSEHISSVKLGQLWEQPMECAVASIFGLDISALYIKVDDITKPIFSNFISNGVDVLLRSAVDAVFAVYKQAFVRILPNMMDGLIRGVLNDALHGFVSSNQNCTDYPLPDSTPNLLNFITEPFFVLVRSLIRDELACGTGACSVTNPPKINSLVIEPVTELQSGVAGQLDFLRAEKGDDISLSLDTGNSSGFGVITIGLGNLVLRNLNSLFDLKLLGVNDSLAPDGSYLFPDQPYTLENYIRAGYSGVGSQPKPLLASIDLVFKAENGTIEMSDNVTLTVGIYDIIAFIDILAKLDLDYTFNLRFRQLFNADCWLATIPEGGIGLSNFAANVGLFTFELLCRNSICSSPGFNEISRRANEPTASAELTKAINDLIDVFEGKYTGVDSFLTRFIDSMAAEGYARCEEKSGMLAWTKNATAAPVLSEVEERNITSVVVGTLSGGLIVAFAVFFGFHVYRAKQAAEEDIEGPKPAKPTLKERVKSVRILAVAKASKKVHGTKNLAALFLLAGAFLAYVIGGNLPLLSYQSPVSDRTYGIGAGIWGSVRFYTGSECTARTAMGLRCWQFTTFGSDDAIGGITPPSSHMLMMGLGVLNNVVSLIAIIYSQQAKKAIFITGISGILAMGVLLVWNDEVCATTLPVPESERNFTSQWAYENLWPTNPSNSCFYSGSWYIVILGMIMSFGSMLLFWFSKRIGIRFGKLGDDGTAAPPRPVDDVVTHTTSLFTSEDIALYIRYGVPFWIFVAYALFFLGHIEVAGSVDIFIKLAGNDIDFEGFQQFSIVNSINDLLKVNAYALAMLLIVFSVMWPYVKLSATAFLWFAPPNLVHPNKRGDAYVWLDVLGKWSMVDIFTLFMFMVAFNIRIVSPGNLIVFPTAFYSIHLMVTPRLGLFSNMIAQLVAQLVSHVIIYQHRNVVAEWDAARMETGSSTSPMAEITSMRGIELGSIGESCAVDSSTNRGPQPRRGFTPPVPPYAYRHGRKRAQRLHEMQLPRDPDVSHPDRLNCYFFVLRTKTRNCLPLLFSAASLVFLIVACGIPSWSFYPKTTSNSLNEEANTYERNFDIGFGLWGSLQTYESEACTQQLQRGGPCTMYTTYNFNNNVIGRNGTSVIPQPTAQAASILSILILTVSMFYSQEKQILCKIGPMRASRSAILAAIAAVFSAVPLGVWNDKFCDVSGTELRERNEFYNLKSDYCLRGTGFSLQLFGMALCFSGCFAFLFSHYFHQRWGSKDESERLTGLSGGSSSSADLRTTPRESPRDTLQTRQIRSRTLWVDAGTTDVSKSNEHLVETLEAVKDHVFEIHGAGYRISLRTSAKISLNLLITAVLMLGVIGCVLPGFQMTLRGVVGVLSEFGETGAGVQRYSVFDVAFKIKDQAQDSVGSQLGINYMIYLFLFCTAVVPMGQMITLAMLWNMQLTLRQQKRLFLFNEILGAWQYMEVWLIAIVLGVIQIGEISAGLVGGECAPLEPVLAQIAALGVIDEADTTCFVVSSKIELGLYILLGCAIGLNLAQQLVVRAAESAMEDREQRIRSDLQKVHRFRSYFFRSVITGSLSFCCACEIIGAEEQGKAGSDLNNIEEESVVVPWADNPVYFSRRTGTLTTSLIAPTFAQPMLAQPRQSRTESILGGRIRRGTTTASELPEGWEQVLDEASGEIYYWAESTDETTWDRPTGPPTGIPRRHNIRQLSST